ncbi:DUF2277 domain-containing protein [Streptomyces sp. NK15101]|uniref:DUF2277 domain-containing protein n=1 Tax=Streptomyces sp. NK15101 TaxID=2873261 RepID=UPI001CEC6D31|nr:DUF2277 domain-containing protein [Streptomyces sp. NK15101]
MCRSIKTLRPPVLPEEATEDDIRAAALQYVRKVSGFRAPAAHNREAFERAVDEIADATARLLGSLEVRGAHPAAVRTREPRPDAVRTPAREPQPDAV